MKYLLIAICILTVGCKSQKITPQSETKPIIPSIINKYQDSLKLKRFGIGALVRHNNVTETHAIGIAGDSIEMTPDKVFNIGSLTKTLTAVLILQEVEKGTITLSDSLIDYFPPELIENKKIDLNITIEQLLRHKSGLGEVVIDDHVNLSKINPYYEYNHINLFKKIPEALDEPGERYRYSNSGYILLGYILEVVNNKAYEDIVEERIFKPAQMNNSYGYYSPTIKNSAHPMFDGYDYKEGTFYHMYKHYSFSAGGIASTLDDLKLFFINLYEKETFIKKETFNKMINSDITSGYGLGIQIFHKLKGEKTLIFGHGGDNFSFKLRNYYNPETKDLVIVFSNQYKDSFTNKIAVELLLKITETK